MASEVAALPPIVFILLFLLLAGGGWFFFSQQTSAPRMLIIHPLPHLEAVLRPCRTRLPGACTACSCSFLCPSSFRARGDSRENSRFYQHGDNQSEPQERLSRQVFRHESRYQSERF